MRITTFLSIIVLFLFLALGKAMAHDRGLYIMNSSTCATVFTFKSEGKGLMNLKIERHEVCVSQADADAVDEYAKYETLMFSFYNWGEEEIAWFYQSYGTDNEPTVNGTRREYVMAFAQIYEQLQEDSNP